MNIRICDYCSQKGGLYIIPMTHTPNDEPLKAELCTQCIDDIVAFRQQEKLEEEIV